LSRATRLDKFSPVRRLFTLDILLE
jgi:hypothetical protein